MLDSFLTGDRASGSGSKRPRNETTTASIKVPNDSIWNEFLVEKVDKNYNYTAVCRHCNGRFTMKATRAKAHIGCIPRSDIAPCLAVPNEIKSKYGLASTLASHNSSQTSGGPKVLDLMQLGVREQVHDSVAEFFYANAIAFNVASSKSFKAMCTALASAPAGYKPPSRDQLDSTLLDRCCGKLKQQVQPIYDKMSVTGASLCSDGYTDSANQSMYNVLISSVHGSVFHKMIIGTDKAKDAQWLFERLSEVIIEVGEHNFVNVIMDNAEVCRAAGKLLMAKFPHITAVGCAAHALDLLLKDASKHEWAADLFASGRAAVKWMKRRQIPYRLFRQQSPQLTLLIPAATRFASNIIMLERFLAVRKALKIVVHQPAFEEYVSKLPLRANKKDQDQTGPRDKAQEIVDIIEDNKLAKDMEKLVQCLLPVVRVLRMCDGNQPAIGFVYPAMYELKSFMERTDDDRASLPFRVSMASMVLERWNWMHNIMHAAAYALNPRYWHVIDDICKEKEVMQGLKKVIAKLTPDANTAAKALSEFSLLYKGRRGSFACPLAVAGANLDTSPPHEWWEIYGESADILQPLAIKVTAQVAAASCCEGNWSNVDHILGKRRLRMLPERTEKLVYCYTNFRVVEQARQKTADEVYKTWGTVNDAEPYLSDSEEEEGEGVDTC